MNNATLIRSLKEIGACEDAREWVREHGGTSDQIWRDCERGDWMAWWIAKQPQYNTTREFYFALADCASLSLRHFEEKYPNDRRPRQAIQTLRKYANGKATREELKSAADAAYAAAYAAAACASAATAAAACAAAATAAAACAAAATADAAAYAAYAAYAADAACAAGIAREKTLKKCADIFRKYFPNVGQE